MAEDNIVEIAKEITDSKNLINNDEIKESLFEARDLVKKNLGIDVSEETLMEIGSLFALPDEYFETIANDFMTSFEKSLNNPADKIALCQSLNMSNIKMEDMLAACEQWNIAIDQSLANSLSTPKRDFLKKIFSSIANAMMDTEGVAKRIITIPIVIEENGTEPTYAKIGDAGVDVYSAEEVTLKPGETKIIHTGIKVEIPKGYELQVRPRSGLSAKSKLRIANAPGTIDSGYRDEIGIICENIDTNIRDIHYHFDDNGRPIIDAIDLGSSIIIEKGERIAQLVLSEIPTIKFLKVDKLNTENDRNGGFGSTGV